MFLPLVASIFRDFDFKLQMYYDRTELTRHLPENDTYDVDAQHTYVGPVQ